MSRVEPDAIIRRGLLHWHLETWFASAVATSAVPSASTLAECIYPIHAMCFAAKAALMAELPADSPLWRTQVCYYADCGAGDGAIVVLPVDDKRVLQCVLVSPDPVV